MEFIRQIMRERRSINALRPLRRAAAQRLYRLAIHLRRLARPLGGEFIYYHLRYRSLQRTTLRYYRHCSDQNFLIGSVKEKNLVFSVTAGRTGTLFTQLLLSLLPDTTSLHEPEPAFHRYLRRVQKDPAFAREFLLNYKLPSIVSYQTRCYCELSHAFCKGYLEPLLDLGVIPKLIILRREPRAIALSLLERNTVPERTYRGLQFLLSPRDPTVLTLAGWRSMSDYQLLFWYALEIERRQLSYAKLVREHGGVAFEITAQELNSLDYFLEMAGGLDILKPSHDRTVLARRHAAIAEVPVNKNRFPLRLDANLSAQEQEVWERIALLDPQRCSFGFSSTEEGTATDAPQHRSADGRWPGHPRDYRRHMLER